MEKNISFVTKDKLDQISSKKITSGTYNNQTRFDIKVKAKNTKAVNGRFMLIGFPPNYSVSPRDQKLKKELRLSVLKF